MPKPPPKTKNQLVLSPAERVRKRLHALYEIMEDGWFDTVCLHAGLRDGVVWAFMWGKTKDQRLDEGIAYRLCDLFYKQLDPIYRRRLPRAGQTTWKRRLTGRMTNNQKKNAKRRKG